MLVRESISFQRGQDPKKTLGIGEEHLPYKIWKELFYEALTKKLLDENFDNKDIPMFLKTVELLDWTKNIHNEKNTIDLLRSSKLLQRILNICSLCVSGGTTNDF